MTELEAGTTTSKDEDDDMISLLDSVTGKSLKIVGFVIEELVSMLEITPNTELLVTETLVVGEVTTSAIGTEEVADSTDVTMISLLLVEPVIVVDGGALLLVTEEPVVTKTLEVTMEVVGTTVEDEDIVSLVEIIPITILSGDKDEVEVDVLMEVLETETLVVC